jgi:hypothetical protein
MIGLIFNSFSSREYLEEKIKLFLKAKKSNNAENSQLIKQAAMVINPRKMDLPVASQDEIFSTLDSSQVHELRDKMATMTRTINRQYPMAQGEHLDSDEFTFLISDFKEYNKGTPLLIRSTNKAKMIRIFNYLQYKNGEVDFIDVQRGDENAKPIHLPLGGPASSLILDLFSGMAKSIGGKAGAAIFDKVFPSSTDKIVDMLKSLQDNIKTVFREELDAQTIDNLNYQLKGVISYMQQTYIPSRASKSKEFLESELSDMNKKMYTEVMALLTGERYRGNGIAYLILGANAHLSIVQEMANIDPDCADPGKSTYMDTYYQLLSSYTEVLQGAINDVNTKRQTYLGNVNESTLQGAATDHWWFVDKWAKYHSPDYYNSKDGCCDYKLDAKSKAVNARTKYNNEIFQPTIATDLKPYNDTLSSWRELLR